VSLVGGGDTPRTGATPSVMNVARLDIWQQSAQTRGDPAARERRRRNLICDQGILPFTQNILNGHGLLGWSLCSLPYVRQILLYIGHVFGFGFGCKYCLFGLLEQYLRGCVGM
jgi:hypothetical protein